MYTTEFKKSIQDIIDKLDEQFMPIYQSQSKFESQSQSQSSQPTIVNNNYYSGGWWPWGGDRVTIINNTNAGSSKKSNSNDDDKKSTASPLLGLVIVGGVAISGVCSLAGSNDQYTMLQRSNLKTDIMKLKEKALLYGNIEFFNKVKDIEKCFIEWEKMYSDRTYQIRNSKITGVFSGLTVGTGFIIGSTLGIYTGAIGLIGAGCLYTWNYLNQTIKTEDRLFDEFFGSLRKGQSLIDHIEQSNQKTIEPRYSGFGFASSFGFGSGYITEPVNNVEPVYNVESVHTNPTTNPSSFPVYQFSSLYPDVYQA